MTWKKGFSSKQNGATIMLIAIISHKKHIICVLYGLCQ